MLLHQYDNETGQYIHSFLADPDPMNEGRWIEPAFTTPATLPERARLEWPFFKDGAWVLLPDYRTLMLYRIDSGEPAEILKAGITPADAGLTAKPRPSALHHWAGEDWELDAAAVAREERAAAMAEFDQLMAAAKTQNAGKADAYAAGLLDALGAALFKAWSAYQMELVRALDAPDFPAVRAWPALPDTVAIKVAVDAEAAAKAAAHAEYDDLVAVADAALAERAEAHAAGQLDAVQLAVFNAWTAYRLQLANLSMAANFPAGATWPAAPDEAVIETAVTTGSGAGGV